MTFEMLERVNQLWAGLPTPARGLIESVVVLGLGLALRALILRIVQSRSDDSRVYYSWRKGTQYVFTFLIAGMIASIWFQGTKDIATFLGLLSAGVAVALKDPLSNLVGWAYVMWQRPFKVGDRIELEDTIGDVIDQRFFSFTMLEVGNWTGGEQSTGRVLHVPNAKVFAHGLYNYTEPFDFIWEEIPVDITFESDWREAKRLLTQVIDARAEEIVPKAKEELSRATRRTLIHYQILSPIVYTSVVAHGVRLTMRYLTPTRQRRSELERAWEATLDAFDADETIQLAYPTQRVLADMRPGPAAPSNHPSTPREAD